MQDEMRERLIEVLLNKPCGTMSFENLADYFIANDVIVLPCKVGDEVYEIEKQCLDCLWFTDGGYSNWCECTLNDDKLMFETDFDKECKYEIIPKKFTFSMIPGFKKTIFRTREEAEKVLKEKNNEGNT